MATMNISLPEPLKEFIEERVIQGGYSTTSEYFRELVREDQKRKSQERMEALLLEGIDSPISLMTSQDWSDIRQAVQERAALRQGSR